jgi:hypothetical protein
MGENRGGSEDIRARNHPLRIAAMSPRESLRSLPIVKKQ